MASAPVKSEEDGEEPRVSLQIGVSSSFCRENERCSASLSPPSYNGARNRKCESDRMVKTELDAAQALTDLAQLAIFEAVNPSHNDKVRRSRKRLKNEARERGLAEGLPQLQIAGSMPRPALDLGQPPLGDPQQQKKFGNHISRRAIKSQLLELPMPMPKCSTGHNSLRGKSKQNLSEAEREAKRLRRVLANRESARQTILRRQAFCEELTKEAADLTLDNESLKREKELVLNEYQFLKERSKELKIQVARMIPEENVIKSEVEVKGEVQETSSEGFSTHAEMQSSSSMHLPQLLHVPPFTPFVWPPVFPLHPRALTQNNNESRDSVTTSNPYQQWGNAGQFSVCWPGAPFYMPPYPWFCPPPSHWPQSCTLSPHTSRERDVDTIDHQCDIRLPSKEREDTETSSSMTKCKDNYSNSMDCVSKQENTTNNIPESLTKIPTDHGGQMLGLLTEDMTPMPTPLRRSTSSSNDKRENAQETDLEPKEVLSPKVDCTACATENFPEASIRTSKKLVDVPAAAEARKRRKELSKLKNLHNRHRFPY